MRLAALAFGVLAGLVASLILALGGLDPSALPQLDPRQMSLISFGLFVVANFGVFGAGIVLAAPLAGVVLLLLGAVGWITAALVLHHGPDFVMLTPPGLLLVAAILAAIAFIRRPRHAPAAAHADEMDDVHAHEHELALAAAVLDPEDEETEEPSPPGVAVGASFFGDSGTATPLRGAIGPDNRDEVLVAADDEPLANPGPIRRRVDPPRQKPMFREPEDEYEDDESGFSRFARALSGVLSFGLYAALAGAAVLVFLNLRTGEATHPTATRIEASADPGKPAAPALLPSSSAPARIAEVPAASSLPPLLAPPAAPLLAGEASPSSTFGVASSIADRELSTGLGAPVLGATAETPQPADDFAASSAAPASSSAEPPAEPVQTAGTAAPLPFAMPPQMAAARSRPAPRPTPPAADTTDTGL